MTLKTYVIVVIVTTIILVATVDTISGIVAMGHRHRVHGADRVETRLEFTQASEDDSEGQPELEVLLAAPDVVPSEEMGARRSPPAEDLDAPGVDRLVPEQRRESASHGLKVRG